MAFMCVFIQHLFSVFDLVFFVFLLFFIPFDPHTARSDCCFYFSCAFVSGCILCSVNEQKQNKQRNNVNRNIWRKIIIDSNCAIPFVSNNFKIHFSILLHISNNTFYPPHWRFSISLLLWYFHYLISSTTKQWQQLLFWNRIQ